MKKEKILRIKIYQPYAHYREPKIMQDDYIPTLSLPPATTIVGMISYMIGRKLNSLLDVAICGTYEKKEINFIRGENIEFWKEYLSFTKYKKNYKTKDPIEIAVNYFNMKKEDVEKLSKKKLNEIIKEKEKEKEKEIEKEEVLNGENYILYKTKKAENRIMNYEVLSEVNLIIYLKIVDEQDFIDVKNALEEIPYYLSIGRKEDFAIFRNGDKVEDISEETEEKELSVEEAIKENIILKNTYIPTALNEKNDEYFLNQGVLYSLPVKYRDITKDKTERKIEHSHFVYVDERGIYPKNKKIAVYKNGELSESFCWMVGI